MALPSNDPSERAFLAALTVVHEYQSDADDAPQARLLEQALWGDDDDDGSDGEGDDEDMTLTGDDNELLLIPELVSDELTDSSSATSATAAQPEQQQQLQYQQLRVTALPNRRNLARRSRKKMFKYKPNKARDGRREELLYLNKKVSELETQLAAVKSKQRPKAEDDLQHGDETSSALTTNTSTAAPDASPQNAIVASVWREIASRQSDERIKAERDNIRLKLVLEHQIKIAKSLESVLHRKLSTKEIEKCVDRKLLHHAYPPTPDSATDEVLFAELLAGIEQSYAEVDSVFDANELGQSENAASDAQVRSDGAGGMFLEFFANKVIPFDMHTTGAAVWQHFVYAKERTPYRFYYNKSHKSIDSTEDTVVENFNLELHANSTSGNFRVKQILRRYVEDERIVIVWRAFVDPIEFSEEPVSGVRFHEKGYIVIKKPQSIMDDSFTLLQQCGISTPMFTDDLMSGDHPKVGAITDFVLSSTAANISASRQMIENVLLEQAMKSDSGAQFSIGGGGGQFLMDV